MSSTNALSRFRGVLVKGGTGRDLGLWPVVSALVIIAVGFQLANSAFLTPRNLSNLTLQTATLAVLTLGVVLVLTLGEIDLSIGAVSGLAASAMAMLSAFAGWPAGAAIGAALALGAFIGLAQGTWIVRFGAPSFIVTLAGMLIWQGVQLFILTPQSGQVLVQDDFITGIASSYLPDALGWILAAVVAMGGAGWIVVSRILTARSGYKPERISRDVFRIALVVVVSLGAVLLLNVYLGVPVLLVIMLAVTLVLAIVAGTTVFGRHIYAVGGSAEASRRTGIRVGALRIVVFTIVATLAALAGVLDASRSFSVSVNTGGGNTALNAIAAAVIGGTSLFGGRGTIIGALLGALVISSVQNGLALIGQTAATQVIVTGLILLAAVTLDVTTRGGAKAVQR